MVMQWLLVLFFILVHLCCLCLLWFSIWPGWIEDIWANLFFWGILAAGLALVGVVLWGLYAVIRRYTQWTNPIDVFVTPLVRPIVVPLWERVSGWLTLDVQRRLSYWVQRLALTAIASVFATHLLIKIDLPIKLGFWIARPAFESELAPLLTGRTSYWSSSSAQYISFYRVKKYEGSRDSGTYFVTGDHGFIFPDTYGFVYQPYPLETPFGDEFYRYHLLVDDWYWFRVSPPWL